MPTMYPVLVLESVPEHVVVVPLSVAYDVIAVVELVSESVLTEVRVRMASCGTRQYTHV